MSLNKIARTTGVFFIASSLLGLFAWINESDPDCYYTTGIALQARFCGDAYVDDPNLPNLLVLALCFIILIVGFILIKLCPKESTADDLSVENEK